MSRRPGGGAPDDTAIDELLLYVHVPFCRKRCDYCDFFGVAGAGRRIMEQTVNSTLEDLQGELNRLQPGRVPSVFFGGGTPSHLGYKLLARLVERVVTAGQAVAVGGPAARAVAGGEPAPVPAANKQDRDAARTMPAVATEVTVELNPEDVDAELVTVLGESGVTRVSVGVQSFDRARRRSIGRAAWEHPAERALELLAGRFALNVDLISSLPRQSTGQNGVSREIEAINADVTRARSFGVEHLSVYSLTLDDTRRGVLARLDDGVFFDNNEEADIDEAVHATIEGHGLRRYEISAYAVPGAECRHNLGYWNMMPYLGVGPGAVSTLPGGPTGVQRTKRVERLSPEAGHGPEIEVESVQPREFLEDVLLMGLRLTDGIDRRRFRQIFGAELWEFAPVTYGRWQDAGLMATTPTHYRPGPGFHALLNSRLTEIFAEIGEPSPGSSPRRRLPRRPSY